MKIRPVGFVFVHADGRTDMMKRMGPLRDYANAPKTHKRKSHIHGGTAEDSRLLRVTSRRWVNVYRRFKATSGL